MDKGLLQKESGAASPPASPRPNLGPSSPLCVICGCTQFLTLLPQIFWHKSWAVTSGPGQSSECCTHYFTLLLKDFFFNCKVGGRSNSTDYRYENLLRDSYREKVQMVF